MLAAPLTDRALRIALRGAEGGQAGGPRGHRVRYNNLVTLALG